MCLSVKIGRLNFLDSSTFLAASLDKISTTFRSFPSPDANRLEDEMFRSETASPYGKG